MGERNYRLLSTVFIAQLAATSMHVDAAARAAGRSWGAGLEVGDNSVRRRSPSRRISDFLEDMGFEPEPRPALRPKEFRLHNCPFRELVDEHQDIVCAVHLGLLEALAQPRPSDRAPAGLSGVCLEPFVEPGICVVRLDRR
jgi:predicted ArsR family transcriptional regulator